MTKREILVLAACILSIAWLASVARALGGDQCVGAINMAGVLNCTNTNCPGTCANGGWSSASGGIDEWQWDGTKWNFVKTLQSGEAQVQECKCDGTNHTCCHIVLIQGDTGIKYGTYGGCVDDCTPPMRDPCKPSGNPTLGDVEAACNP